MVAALQNSKRKRAASTRDTEEEPHTAIPENIILRLEHEDVNTDYRSEEEDGQSLSDLDYLSDSGTEAEYDGLYETIDNELNSEDALTASASGSSDDLKIFPQAITIKSHITGESKVVYPEIDPSYDSESSTEEDPYHVGNIPSHWYDDLPHIGYSINGKKILRPAKGDALDKFLQTMDDPSNSTFDPNLQIERQLTSEELDLIRRLAEYEKTEHDDNFHEPTIEWFTGKGKEEIMPLSAAPEPKRRWIPSKWEKSKVMKIVRAIRDGRILPNNPKTAATEPRFYSLWSTPANDFPTPAPAPAPKPRLPVNSESYNPPSEYLPTEKEKTEWEALDKEDRDRDYLPQKHSAFRLVPAYREFIQERFARQLDLYLAPRIQRKKLNIDPESLVPKLPSPESLKPFPTYNAIRISQSYGKARAVSISPDGAWVVGGYENGVVSLWETVIGREVKCWTLKGRIGAIDWCPRRDVSFFVVGIDDQLHFFLPPLLSASTYSLTISALAPVSLPPAPASPSPVKWTPNAVGSNFPILSIHLPISSGLTKQIVWHRRGDYLASVSGSETGGVVWMHQVSKRHSQAPFMKVKGSVQLVQFHPSKPYFFLASQKHIRLYDLAGQKLMKTLTPGLRWISSLDIHPSGNHLIVGGYDRRLCWFDLELSDKPYKVIRYHTRAIRSLHFHPTYPLFASSSDDSTIQIFHSRVYNDFMTDPLIVPLKILRGHGISDGLGVLQVKWCPSQPWLLSAGADGIVGLWCS